jgi:hypothetical protein
MRTIEWAEWQSVRRAMSGAAVAIAVAQADRPMSHRPRTPEEREMIIRGTVALMRRREREGRLVRTGSREYELRPAVTNHR